jgi:hypothetical protein
MFSKYNEYIQIVWFSVFPGEFTFYECDVSYIVVYAWILQERFLI